MKRCPVCRARLRGRSELCRRCGSELSLLYEIEEQAGNLKAAAVRAWAAGELQTAVELARRSLGLKDEADVRIILRFLASQVDESRLGAAGSELGCDADWAAMQIGPRCRLGRHGGLPLQSKTRGILLPKLMDGKMRLKI